MENILKLYNPTFQQRVNYLIYSLSNTNKLMDEVACEIDDINLSSAISGLASESCRYISELFVECKRFGLSINVKENSSIPFADALENSNYSYGFSWLVEKSAKEIEAAYQTVLNEPHPFIHLKELMSHQFTSLKSSFSKLKLLSTTSMSSNI